MTDNFDMIVIGSGPAGEKAAAQAAYFGKRVALIERSATLGGAAVANAGILSKTLRESALYLTGFRRRDAYHGLHMEIDPDATVATMRDRSAEVIAMMNQKVLNNIERHGIDLIRGEATINAENRVHVTLRDGQLRTISGEVILVATGSRPLRPSSVPFHDTDVFDSEDIVGVDRPFRSIVVVGGGPVGCEYASIFLALGVDVTLVDRSDRLLPFMDAEIAHSLDQTFRDSGMHVILDAGKVEIGRADGQLTVSLSSGDELRPERVLFAAGRVGNIEGLGLEDVGVAMDARNRLIVDDQFQTTATGIYAAGDVIGAPALASVSVEQGRVAACYAFGFPFKKTLDPLPPFGIYSIPEAAMAGLSEEAAKARGVEYEVGRGRFSDNARAMIGGSTEGMVKLLFDPRSRMLLGVHVLGDDAAELVHHGQAVLHHRGTIDHFIDSTYNTPTRSEAYKYAAYDGLQNLQADQARVAVR